MDYEKEYECSRKLEAINNQKQDHNCIWMRGLLLSSVDLTKDVIGDIGELERQRNYIYPEERRKGHDDDIDALCYILKLIDKTRNDLVDVATSYIRYIEGDKLEDIKSDKQKGDERR